MPSIILDPGLFAIPPYANDESEIYDVVRRLIYWSDVLDSDAGIAIFKPSGTEEALALANCWPVEPDIEALINSCGLNEVYSANDLAGIYLVLLSRILPLGETIDEVLEFDSLNIDPDPTAGHSPEPVVYQTKIALLSCALAAQGGRGDIFFGSGLTHPGVENIAINARILRTRAAINFDEDGVDLNIRLPLLRRLEDIAVCTDPRRLWDSASTASDLHLALSMGCLALMLRHGTLGLLSDVQPFSIGSEFLTSLQAVQAGPNQARSHLAFDAASRVVWRQPKYDLRPMGKPAQIVRSRDQARAYRTHITKRHDALRLMIWDVEGTYEFANMANKGDVLIVEGDAPKVTSISWKQR